MLNYFARRVTHLIGYWSVCAIIICLMTFVEETVDKICVHLYSAIINKNKIKLIQVWTFLLLTYNTIQLIFILTPRQEY